MEENKKKKIRPKMYYGYYVCKYRQDASKAEKQIRRILGDRKTVKIYTEKQKEHLLGLLQKGDVFAAPSPYQAAIDINDFLELMATLKQKGVHVIIPPIDLDYCSVHKSSLKPSQINLDEFLDSLRLFTPGQHRKGRPNITFSQTDLRFREWYFHGKDFSKLQEIADTCHVSTCTIRRWTKMADNYFKKEEIEWVQHFRKLEEIVQKSLQEDPTCPIGKLSINTLENRHMLELIALDRPYTDTELIEIYRTYYHKGYLHWLNEDDLDLNQHTRSLCACIPEDAITIMPPSEEQLNAIRANLDNMKWFKK